jgi:hypothetical protein
MSIRNKFLKYKYSRPNIEDLKKKLDLKIDEWDAISFFKTGPLRSYVFNIIKFIPKNGKVCEYEMHPDGFGHKFNIVYHEVGGPRHDVGTLGDPIYILLNNYIYSDMQGFLIKRCPEGNKMAENIVEHAQMTAKAIKVLAAANVAVNV